MDDWKPIGERGGTYISGETIRRQIERIAANIDAPAGDIARDIVADPTLAGVKLSKDYLTTTLRQRLHGPAEAALDDLLPILTEYEPQCPPT